MSSSIDAPHAEGIPRFDAVDALTDRAMLERIFGAVRAVESDPMTTVGFSSSTFHRLRVRLESGGVRRLVLKRTLLGSDWLARRGGDEVGREVAAVSKPALAEVWEAFACPYVACAAVDGERGLLMHDLSEHLFPDVREPIASEAEESLLASLATLHARFWDSPVLEPSWLARPSEYFDLLGPRPRHELDAAAPPPPVIRDGMRDGWAAALRRLPPELAATVSAPAAELAAAWSDLPCTLLHGDVKVANMAILDDGRVAAFDWARIGAGPATLDLGWFLAVNASRLARSKDAVIARYRELLEAGLRRRLPDPLWRRMLAAGIWCGAAMLLWSKALAVEKGRPGAEEEWGWWVGRLEGSPVG